VCSFVGATTGLDEGLKDMCVDEIRRVKIPSHLAYGKRGLGESIPPNVPVVIDCFLMSINYRDIGSKVHNFAEEAQLAEDHLEGEIFA
jgi:FKBP-type peptidyl-prolyl cis-trans isomerase